jgi:hypothetical protein
MLRYEEGNVTDQEAVERVKGALAGAFCHLQNTSNACHNTEYEKANAEATTGILHILVELGEVLLAKIGEAASP